METNPYLNQLKSLVVGQLALRPVKVILFGSRARGDASPHSDVDIGIFSRERLDPRAIGDLKEKIENSNIPFQVDIVDLSEAAPEFRRQALKEAVIWKDLT